MNINGPVIIIEDDSDDQELLLDVFTQLQYPNEIIFFTDGEKALNYLNKTETIPFLILSDINMPRLDGFALRNKIHTDAELQIKCIPYLFFSTAATQKAVVEAYSLSVQGFFLKQNTHSGLVDTIKVIMDYWRKCVAPNSFPVS
jgi:CheY-like chemotaxis protein